jgi:hypothetical protein
VLACIRFGEFSALALGGGGHRKLLWRRQPDTARGAWERVLLLTIHNYCCQPRTPEGCGFFIRALDSSMTCSLHIFWHISISLLLFCRQMPMEFEYFKNKQQQRFAQKG